MTPDGRRALSGSTDNVLRLWDLATGRCVRALRGHTERVTSLALAADGRWALSGSWDRTVRIWELASGRCLQTLEGHVGRVTSVALTPDGRWGLSGSATKGGVSDDRMLSGNALRVWELDWECEFPDASDWDEGARPYLETFLNIQRPFTEGGLTRVGQPSWTDEDFQRLLVELQYRGYGWLRPQGVRRQLEKMTTEWNGPPPIPGS